MGLPNEAGQIPESRGKRSSVTAVAVVLACFLLPLARLLILVRDFTVEILYFDQIEFYDPFFQNFSWMQIFRFQHGQHRLGIGGILQSIVLNASSWRNSAVSHAIVLLLVLAACAMLFFKWRQAGRLEMIDGVIPILFLTSNQYETLVVAPSLSAQIAPLLSISLLPLILFIQSTWVRYMSLCVLVYLSVFSGYGYVVAIILIPILLLVFLRSMRLGMRSEAWGAAVTLGVSGLSLFDFARDLQWITNVECFTFPHQPVYEYAFFVALMPAKFIGFSYLLMPRLALLVGTVLMAAVFAVVWIRLRDFWRTGSVLSLAILSLVLFSLTFDAMTAIGRICTGLYASGSSRYMTLTVPLFVALFLHFSLSGKKMGWAIAALIGVMALGGYMPPRLSARASLADQAAFERGWRDCYLRTESVEECYRTVPGVLHPDPVAVHLQDKLQFLKAHRLNLYATGEEAGR
jgi:hypothetical protein